MRFYAAILGTLCIMAGTMGLAGRAEQETIDGFLSPVADKKILPDSAPAEVKLLSKTRTARDTLDLELMAKWSLNYLAGSVSEEQGFASSYGNWPLKMPPYALGGDKIAVGD